MAITLALLLIVHRVGKHTRIIGKVFPKRKRDLEGKWLRDGVLGEDAKGETLIFVPGP